MQINSPHFIIENESELGWKLHWLRAEHEEPIDICARRLGVSIDTVDKIECGIVYKTEAILNDNDLKIVAEAENNTEIIYSIAVLKNSSKEKMAREFIEYLYTEKSLNIFKEYGFDIID